MKLVDTKDLKSLPFGSASSSLAEGTIKNIMLKFHFIFDKTKKAEKLKKKYIRIYKNHSPRNADHIIVAGGDGFMLSTLKRFSKYINLFME